MYEGSGWGFQPCNPKFPEFKHKRLDIAYMGNLDSKYFIRKTNNSFRKFITGLKCRVQSQVGGPLSTVCRGWYKDISIDVYRVGRKAI